MLSKYGDMTLHQPPDCRTCSSFESSKLKGWASLIHGTCIANAGIHGTKDLRSCREVWSNMAEEITVKWLLQELRRLETEIVAVETCYYPNSNHYRAMPDRPACEGKANGVAVPGFSAGCAHLNKA